MLENWFQMRHKSISNKELSLFRLIPTHYSTIPSFHYSYTMVLKNFSKGKAGLQKALNVFGETLDARSSICRP